MRREVYSLQVGDVSFKSTKTRSGKNHAKIKSIYKKNTVIDFVGVGDTEQTVENNQSGVVFSWTVISVKIDQTNKKATTTKKFTILFSDSIDYIRTNKDHKSNKTFINKIDDMLEIVKNEPHKIAAFKPGMDIMLDFIKTECGNNLCHHSISRDIQFLKNTQCVLKKEGYPNYRFFQKNDLINYSITGDITYNKNWPNLGFYDACQLSKVEFSPLFARAFYTFFKIQGKGKTIKLGDRELQTNLLSLCRFVYNDMSYEQKHLSTDDAMDLFHVVKVGIEKYDLKINIKNKGAVKYFSDETSKMFLDVSEEIYS